MAVGLLEPLPPPGRGFHKYIKQTNKENTLPAHTELMSEAKRAHNNKDQRKTRLTATSMSMTTHIQRRHPKLKHNADRIRNRQQPAQTDDHEPTPPPK
jgi:hypothetical protein